MKGSKITSTEGLAAKANKKEAILEAALGRGILVLIKTNLTAVLHCFFSAEK